MIRKATYNDMPEIHRMAKHFYASTSYAAFAEYNETSVEAIAGMMMDTGVFLIAEADGKPCGMVGLVISPFMFNGTHLAAYEVIWWVDESARSTGAGKALLLAIEPACRERNVTAIQMVHLENSPEHAGKLYERIGFRHTESSYTKVI